MINFLSHKLEQQTFVIRTSISDETVSHMVKDLEEIVAGQVHLAPVSGGVVKEWRSTKSADLPLSFWGSLLLEGAVVAANKRHFNFDLTEWSDPLQYLLYDAGDHYKKWHCDQIGSLYNEGEIRKLTAILALSDPDEYEGGEFCYYYSTSSERIKFNKGEIIIFPAALQHRVLPVKSGTRKTLIGWYGGPPFK